MKNYYEILEVNNKASKEVIEKAYKVLIKKYHPDLYVGEAKIQAERKTKDINEAYKILSDAFLKEQYDLELEKENNQKQTYNNLNNNNNPKNIRQNNNRIKNKKEDINQKEEPEHKVGTFMAMIDLLKTIFRQRPKGEKRKIQREDKIAAGLTFIIVVILGVIMWFIPATNGFIRSLIPF